MKKCILLLSVVVLSCGTKTNDDIIKESFNNYAEMNFDDPSHVKEVVGVTYGDTLCSETFAEMVSEIKSMSDSLGNLSKELPDKANALAHKHGNRVRYNPLFIEAWRDYEKSLKNNMEKRWELVSAVMSDGFVPITKDSILNYQDFSLLEFTIEYRIKEGDDLKLKEKNGFLDLKTSEVYFDEVDNKSLLNFINEILKTMKYYNSLMELESDVIEKSQKVISYLE